MITVKRFTARWCGPCRMLAPIMNNLETEYPQVTFEVIDTEESPLEVTKYDIRSIPTVIILKDDVVREVLIGVQSTSTYIDAITASLT
jgi:thioredoxin 1